MVNPKVNCALFSKTEVVQKNPKQQEQKNHCMIPEHSNENPSGRVSQMARQNATITKY